MLCIWMSRRVAGGDLLGDLAMSVRCCAVEKRRACVCVLPSSATITPVVNRELHFFFCGSGDSSTFPFFGLPINGPLQ